MPTDLKSMSLQELEGYVRDVLGEKPYRAAQIYRWMYGDMPAEEGAQSVAARPGGVTSFSAMWNLPAALRDKLSETASLGILMPQRVQVSRLDGTRKYLFALPDGLAIESVLMTYRYGSSLCISAQAGCRMGCTFCASGLPGLSRDLTAGEMMEEVLAAERESGLRIGHVDVMGSGEPFDTYEAVGKFLHLLHAPEGPNLSWRRMTVSTCGLTDGIARFAKDFPQVNLAVSLHAPDDAIRQKLMPVARAYPMDRLLAACRAYTETTKRRITFEYMLIRGINDAPSHANALAKRLRGLLCHVNLIPMNAVSESGYEASERSAVSAFQDILERQGIPVTVRRRLGADIDGACGQLRLREM